MARNVLNQDSPKCQDRQLGQNRFTLIHLIRCLSEEVRFGPLGPPTVLWPLRRETVRLGKDVCEGGCLLVHQNGVHQGKGTRDSELVQHLAPAP